MSLKSIKERAQKLQSDIPAVFLALKHKGTPWYAKALAAVTVGYALSPIDLIPDFIPVLGYLDDLLLLPALVWLVVKLIPKDVFDDCRKRSEGMWSDGKPKKWYYSLPIAAVWLLIILLIVKSIWF